ncbi:hypothetical protein R0J91_11365, partial [Micrococcus sp. SIMBA_131]
AAYLLRRCSTGLVGPGACQQRHALLQLATADALALSDDDTLILRGDQVEDSVTLTLAPRLQSKLILLERVPREVSL